MQIFNYLAPDRKSYSGSFNNKSKIYLHNMSSNITNVVRKWKGPFFFEPRKSTWNLSTLAELSDAN